MKLVFLHANQAWVFLFGGTLTDMGGQTIFNEREAAVSAARMCGLRVTRTGEVM